MPRTTIHDDPEAARPGAPSHRLCIAQRCPAPATTFDGLHGEPSGGRCRYHDGARAELWPAVTALLLRSQSVDETDAGLEALGLRVRVPVNPAPVLERVSIPEAQTKLSAFIAEAARAVPDPDRWWHELVRRWRAGAPLLQAQRRAALAAWEAAGKPDEHAPPGYSAMELETVREALAERAAIQAEGQP